jgi:hypothetical membrane protein
VRRLSAAASGQAAILGVVLYVALDVALVFLRPHLSVLHNAESDYGSKGAYGWVMNVNFVLRCVLSLLVVRGLALSVPTSPRLRAGLLLLGAWAVGSGLLAFFPDDPVGARVHGAARVHLVLAVVVFIAVVLGTRMATRALAREEAWRPVRAPLLVLSWGALVPVLLLGHAHLRPHSLGGLYEKIFLGVELAWLLLAAVWVSVLAEAPGRSFAGEAVAEA